jgi:hypothetical protein
VVAFSRPYHSLRPCSCSCARAGPSHPFSCVVGTVRSRGSDPFDCDGGLHCVCDEPGPGFDYDGGLHCVCDALLDCGCRVLWPYDLALGHVASTMASGGGGGDGVVGKKTGFLVRVIDGAEAE